MSGFQVNGVPVQKLRVVDLKEELDARGLSKSGKKDELIARLVSYLEANPEEGGVKDDDEGSSDSKDEMMKKWQEEREQLLRENEERRQEEERKQKEEEERLKAEEEQATQKAEEERLAQEAAAKAKAEADAEKAKKEHEAAEAKRKADEEAEKQKAIEEEAERKKAKEEEIKRQKEAEAEAKLLKEQEALKAKEEAKDKERQEKEQKRKEEERKQREELERKAREEEEQTKKKAEEAARKSAEESKAKEEESKDEVGEDTLVMEIDQHDLVAEDTEEEATEPVKEDKQPEIPAEPGQVKSLRKLGGGSKAANEERKRGWGVSKVTNGNGASSISSESLKDIVPDPKPLMESTEAAIEEQGEADSVESDPDVAGPKVPDSVKKADKEEPIKKKKKITLTEDDNESAFVLIRNLTRPFTLKGFQEMLKRTGTLEDFWIDRIKSTCCVKFANSDEASETRMALNGVTWPVGNPKTLSVSFITEETMTKYKQTADGVLKPSNDPEKERDRVREWDRNKTEERGDERRSDKRQDRDREVRLRERSREPPVPTKSLEELFKKTAATPSIYWKPLTDQQIKERIELRNKKMMEAKILKEMQDTKDTLEKSQKLISRSPR